MKILATILVLAVGIFVNTSAQTTNSLRALPGSLEIVLNLGRKYVYSNSIAFYAEVRFGRTTNIAMEVTFRNVGEISLICPDLLHGLTVIWDGKEYVYGGEQGYFGRGDIPPHTPWRAYASLPDYPIPKEALTSGRHTIAVKSAGVESNIQVIFIDPQLSL